MTTDPSSHRAQADDFLGDALQMSNLEDLDVGDAVGLGILHGILALHDLLAGALGDEALVGDALRPARRELDEDNPDTLVEDDDTVEQHFGLAYIDDVGGEYQPGDLARYGYPAAEPADRVRLSGFGAIHRHDDFGYPWGAA